MAKSDTSFDHLPYKKRELQCHAYKLPPFNGRQIVYQFSPWVFEVLVFDVRLITAIRFQDSYQQSPLSTQNSNLHYLYLLYSTYKVIVLSQISNDSFT